MIENIISYKGFDAVIGYSADDNEFFGNVIGIEPHGVNFGGKTVAELKKHMKEAVDGYLEFCKEKKIEPKKPHSGRITYRTTPKQHAELSRLAVKTGQGSINAFIDAAIKHYKSQLLEKRT
jgi:predicted HicB family RNase H-like nuclease